MTNWQAFGVALTLVGFILIVYGLYIHPILFLREEDIRKLERFPTDEDLW